MHHLDVRPCADRRAGLLLMAGAGNSPNGIGSRPSHKVDQLAKPAQRGGQVLVAAVSVRNLRDASTDFSHSPGPQLAVARRSRAAPDYLVLICRHHENTLSATGNSRCDDVSSSPSSAALWRHGRCQRGRGNARGCGGLVSCGHTPKLTRIVNPELHRSAKHCWTRAGPKAAICGSTTVGGRAPTTPTASADTQWN